MQSHVEIGEGEKLTDAIRWLFQAGTTSRGRLRRPRGEEQQQQLLAPFYISPSIPDRRQLLRVARRVRRRIRAYCFF